MKIQFEYLGKVRTLSKHSKVMRDLRAGGITPDQAATKPWYLRLTIAGKETLFVLPAKDKDAERAAKDILKGQVAAPEQFTEFLRQKQAQRSLTLGTLAQEWLAKQCPFNALDQRRPAASAELKEKVTRALPWWTDKPVATITHKTLEDYAAHRAPATRAVDLELAALSSLCKWAVLDSRIEKNPFAKRRRFRKSEDTAHCHEACPANDETLHQMLAQFWCPEQTQYTLSARETAAGQPDPRRQSSHRHEVCQRVIAGGWLAFCALTGLRPGEPKYLQRLPVLDKTPDNPKALPPGSIFPDRTGQLRLKVQRLKRGQNPFITIHPALEQFLTAWRAWLAAHVPDAAVIFPLETEDQTYLNRCLNQASAALGLAHYKPHGFGRAYYVRVRRSQGADDATIAGELGQSTNGELIRSVYGDPDDLRGGSMFDWLPEDTAPAWNLLSVFRFCYDQNKASSGTMRQDTAHTNEETAASKSSEPLANQIEPVQTPAN